MRRRQVTGGIPRPGRSALLAAAAAAAVLAAAWAATSAPPLARAGVTAPASQARHDPSCPWAHSRQPIARRVADVMSQMTLADEIHMVEGHGTTHPYVFFMAGIPRLCIPAMGLEDGPNGVGDRLTGVTQLPAGVGLAATWDRSLARSYGAVIGAEEAGKGVSVDLGPTVNIDRDPRWGRSFESYTEDPFLDAAMATSEISGVQSQRVMAQVKHFDAYNQETSRNTRLDNVIVSTRALREIYLPAFRAAIQRAGAASVMCAYSTVNGNYSCQNPYLLTSVLKQEWGFAGFVTSDAAALHSTVRAALAGADMEQPFHGHFGAALLRDVRDGVIPRAVLTTIVQRILTQMFRFHLISHPRNGSASATVTTPAHVALAVQVAQDGTTLLKNSRHALPLPARHAGTVAVIGPAASASPTYGGGGSAHVLPSHPVSPMRGLRSAAGPGTHITYRQGLPADTALPAIPPSALSPAYTPTGVSGGYTGTLTAPQTGTYVLALTNNCHCYKTARLWLNGRDILNNPGTPPVSTYSAAVRLRAGHTYTVKIKGASSSLAWGTPSHLAPGIATAVKAARSASAAIVVVSDDTESEAADRASLRLPSAQDELVSAVAAANRHTVVVVDAGAPVAMPWLHRVAAVLDAWYPGEASGTALANVIFGRADPGGHLPVTFPASLSQVPGHTRATFPGTGGRVHYSGGVDVGYRWYESQGSRPLFPFGFGLSYTSFRFSHLSVSPAVAGGDRSVQVSATVTNVGRRAGSDVAQLYLGDPRPSGEPPRQLAGFQRVRLVPGESARVHFTVTPRDRRWWDQPAGGWNQSAGIYHVYVGDSSSLPGLPLRGAFWLAATPGARKVVITAPRTMRPGQACTVRVTLTATGGAALGGARLSLQVPPGWTAWPVLSDAPLPTAPTVTFRVRPPRWAPAADGVLHATASLGQGPGWEAGVTVTVAG